jgi:two-component system, LytTR family, sensor kinase
MVMKLKLPQYSGKDYMVLAVILLPLTIIINAVLFGIQYFQNWLFFLSSTVITAVAFSLYFTLCGMIAVLMKNRFPYEHQATLKITLMILTFVTMTGLFLLLLFRGYEAVRFFGYRFNEHGFVWAYISMAIVNIFLTLLLEGISRFEDWRRNLKETEQLKKTFKQSQLHGLKSQVNPHFLFNSLNTLSCLISEDEDKAEKFLNEMTKVYRYMLRSDDEQLVTVEEELKFIESYQYLLESRFGDGLKINVNVKEQVRNKFVPALALQTLIENAFSQNTISKNNPLIVTLGCDCDYKICVSYNRQAKSLTEPMGYDQELDNLVKKYTLLNQPPVIIEERETDCCVFLPLITNEEEVAV